jgi:hypothetical protein
MLHMDHVRFGSKADMCGAQADVCFVPIADICLFDDLVSAPDQCMGNSDAAQKIMSALLPKADMCSALADVRYVPIADISRPFRPC